MEERTAYILLTQPESLRPRPQGLLGALRAGFVA